MATTVQNPFDTQQASATNNGVIGSAMQTGSTSTAPDTDTTASANNITSTPAPAANTVSNYNPTTREIDKPTGTVQGQVNSILATDNPLMQRARTLATQQMAQRGLVNSSMNAGAGVAAMTDKAIAIGSQDANAYNQAASENMTAKNTAGQVNSTEANKFSLQTGQQTFAASQNVATQNFQAAQAQLDRAQQIALTDKSVEAQKALQTAQQNFTGAQAALDRTQQTALQTGQQTFTAGQTALERKQQTDITNIQVAAQKDLQTAQQTFSTAQAALDRAQQVALTDKSITAQQNLQKAQQDFTGAQAGLDRAQQTNIQNDQQAFQVEQQKIQNDFAAQTQKLQESGLDFRQARDIASQEAMKKLELAGVTNRFDQELALKSSQFNIEQNNLAKRQLADNQNELDKLGIQIKANNAQIPTQFAANIANTTMNGVNAILADGNMTAAAKQTSITNLATYANAQIAWAEKFYGTTINKITVPTLA